MSFQEIFAKELKQLNSDEVRESLVDFTAINWDAFLADAPSSSSGKYHPPDERGDGGWVLHAHRVFNLCGHFSIAFELDDYSHDVLLAAALIHDLYQFRVFWGSDGQVERYETQEDHPMILAKKLRDHAATSSKYDHAAQKVKILQDIASLVELHSGRWAPSGTVDRYWDELVKRRMFPAEEDFLGFLLHMADYIASRNNVFVTIPGSGWE